MKIGNWNIERLKKIKAKDTILNELNLRNFDILVLTEYDERIEPRGFHYSILTESLVNRNTDNYNNTERRTALFSKYPILQQFETFDKYTACCAELKTEFGNLVVYGTIMGIYGNRNENFKVDLERQIYDFKKITPEKNICIIGDYNQSFSDNYYYTKLGREKINEVFKELKIENLTSQLLQNIDHISISENFINTSKVKIETWNMNKTLSDHIGVSIEIGN